MSNIIPKLPPLPSRKFYLLDYFFIFLSSVENRKDTEDIFSFFKVLKQEHRLGESKYKKLEEVSNPTPHQQKRYKYTFKKVLDECKEYGLVTQNLSQGVFLTKTGTVLLEQYRTEGMRAFNLSLFKLMEHTHKTFRTLVDFIYKANPKSSGVLVFPHYSPLELNFDRKQIRTSLHLRQYTFELVKKLQSDIDTYLKRKENLNEKNQDLILKLENDSLLPREKNEAFNPKDYNKITKRIRDFWISFFLQDLYQCPYSMTSFDLWGYRARQIGIIQSTESYPFFNGKLVYPTSVVAKSVRSEDFTNIYKYEDGYCLFVHNPKLGNVYEGSIYQNKFVDALVKGYFDLRRQVRYNFINLVSLRELVCFRLKLSLHSFEKLLNEIYKLNLSGNLSIKISLEVDKLPEETSALYMKREPVMVDGSYRNIIAIDVAKGRM